MADASNVFFGCNQGRRTRARSSRCRRRGPELELCASSVVTRSGARPRPRVGTCQQDEAQRALRNGRGGPHPREKRKAGPLTHRRNKGRAFCTLPD